MKKLLLVRHAKAVHDNAYNDFERPLKKSGIKDAEFMAEKLTHEKIMPQIIVTSPAIRTLATADILSEFLSVSKPKEDKRIYEAGRAELLDVISEFDDKHNFVALVGHNPTIEEVAHYLSGQRREFSPGTIALIEFDFDDWQSLSAKTGTLKWFGSPD